MKKYFCIYLFVSLFFLCDLFSQTTVQLTADYDAAIGFHDNHNTANTNYGNAHQNAAYTIPGTYGGINVNRALIHFDLSLIPVGSTILSAKLNLFALGPVGILPGHMGADNNALLQRIIQPWADNTVTWNNQPSTTIQNEVILPASTNSTQDYLNINVTSLVQDMLITNNYGFLLKLANEALSNALVFSSLDCGNPLKFPVLEVTYLVSCVYLSAVDAAIGYHDNHNTANTNYGNAPQNAAYVIPGTYGGLNVNRALMFFDLSSIPSDAEISSAHMNLYGYGQTGPIQGHTGPDNSAVLQRVLQPWSEYTVTWNNQPNSTTQNEVTLLESVTSIQDYLDIDVKLLVEDMLLTNNYGFLLKLVDESLTKVLIFCSNDHVNNQKRPELKVCFKRVADVDKLYIEQQKLFDIFPNPSSNFVNVNVNNSMNINSKIIIYNANGQLVKEIITKDIELTIDTGSFTEGLYFVKVFSGDLLEVQKLVVIK